MRFDAVAMRLRSPAAVDAFLESLPPALADRIRRNESMSGHTTSRLGGPADLWLPANSLSELIEVVTLGRRYQVPFFMLGAGANLLISDAGIRGLVIENRAKQVHYPASGGPVGSRKQLIAESGTVLPNLARRCVSYGLSGLEWAVGVPGTVGGAIANNAGAYGQDMATSLIRAELLSLSGERVWQPADWFEYGYRTSRLKRQRGFPWIVLQAELALKSAPASEVKAVVDRLNERRKESQPPGATMGSMFKNPPGDYAGRLIEAAGLKGYQIGQAPDFAASCQFFSEFGRGDGNRHDSPYFPGSDDGCRPLWRKIGA